MEILVIIAVLIEMYEIFSNFILVHHIFNSLMYFILNDIFAWLWKIIIMEYEIFVHRFMYMEAICYGYL